MCIIPLVEVLRQIPVKINNKDGNSNQKTTFNISAKISLFSLEKRKAQACKFLYVVLQNTKVWRYFEFFVWYVRLT